MKSRLWIGAGGILAVLGATATLISPSVTPSLIRLKARVLGPSATYRPLAHSGDLWAIVTHGVSSGDTSWLRVAVDLRPALDTHPGEAMLAAVAAVFENNTVGAMSILLPVYGPDEVCGRDEEYRPLDPMRAQMRLRLLSEAESGLLDHAAIQDCVALLEQLRDPATQVEQGG